MQVASLGKRLLAFSQRFECILGKYGRFLALYFVVFAALYGAWAQDLSYSDAHIKAAYIIKIRDFVSFPPAHGGASICVVGNDVVGISLAHLSQSDQKTNIKSKTLSSNFNECIIVFLGVHAENETKRILDSISHLEILTIGETKDFIQKGGIIGFVTIDNKIKIEVNNLRARAQNISISSRLLGVAHKVINE